MNGLTPEIAHFVKNNNRYIFQDTYNQFPGSIEKINDIAIVGDSLFLATDVGLIKAWLYHANLKPESAWSSVALDSATSVSMLFASGDSLLFLDQDMDVYCYHFGEESKLLEGHSQGVAFVRYDSLYYASQSNIYNLNSGSSIYESTGTISGFTVDGDRIWLSEENRGLELLSRHGGEVDHYIPNTMLYTKANSLAITEDQHVIVSGIDGASVLHNGVWHNYLYSNYIENIDDEKNDLSFSSDTLNIAHRGGSAYVIDALVTSSGKLYNSISDVSIKNYNSGKSPNAEGPGALQWIDLNDPYNYGVFDTSGGVIDGTQGLGLGDTYYLIMRGLAEDKYGNVWAINAHTLAGETLLKIRPNGDVVKYSVEDSGGKLQILAREMVFDKYGRLWIANQARQEDEPRTTGGITVFDPSSGIWALITSADGLVSNDVYSIDEDPLTGNMWVATASGVQMIRTPSSFAIDTDFSMNPAIDGLSGMVPVKLRIDPRGNKWILTQSQGIQIYMTNNRWFDEGNGLSAENSGLLDNVVYDLVFDKVNGYAYLLTASGLNRYEIAWTEERTEMNNVIVFPQPFRPGIDPYIAFDGLADQSQVRISTIDGRSLIRFEADADENKEKQLVWDGKLPNGNYISRGVYLAFITNIDGQRSTVKFAVK